MDKRIMVLLAVSLFILAGCKEESVTIAGAKPFIGGTDAIEFEFIEGSPPPEVYDGGSYPFEVTLNIENQGEYDVPADKINVKLAGFYPLEFDDPEDDIELATSISKPPEEDLKKSYIDSEGNTITGTITYLTFNGFNFHSSLSANNEYKIRANVCYEYGTIAQADMCVLDDLTKTKDEVCKITEKKTVYSSSAPIQIENFEESVAGTDKIAFSFEIVHRGSGAVSNKDAAIDCSGETIDKNKVWVKVGNDLANLECSGLSGGTSDGTTNPTGTEQTGSTTLYGGKRMIRCTQDLSALEGDFEKKVNIEVVYDYKEHKETTVLVKHTTP